MSVPPISDRDPDLLLARIALLERRLAAVIRRLVVGAAVVAIGAMVAVATARSVVSAQGRDTPSEIVATSVKLVDASGKPRAVLYVDGQTAGLALSDPAGQTRVLLNTDGESSKLAIVGAAKGFPRLVLAQQGDVQMLNLEDANTSHVGLLHAPGTASVTVASGPHSAEMAVAEVVGRGVKPALAPTVVLKQGDRTVAALSSTPSR